MADNDNDAQISQAVNIGLDLADGLFLAITSAAQVNKAADVYKHLTSTQYLVLAAIADINQRIDYEKLAIEPTEKSALVVDEAIREKIETLIQHSINAVKADPCVDDENNKGYLLRTMVAGLTINICMLACDYVNKMLWAAKEKDGKVDILPTSTIMEKRVWPEYFEAIISGAKNFDLRLDDFAVKAGDVVVLREWDPAGSKYTGREVKKLVKYVLKTKGLQFWPDEAMQKHGFVVMGF